MLPAMRKRLSRLAMLAAALALSGCLGKAQYERYKNSAQNLGQAWQDEQDRAYCSRGNVILGSLAYTQCRLDLNAKRLDKAKAASGKESGSAKDGGAAKP